MKYFFILILILMFTSCKSDVQPKPNGFLKLSYPKHSYKTSPENRPFRFEYAGKSQIFIQENHWFDIIYPHLKAGINATYHPVKNNLFELARDAEKLTYKHAVKADNIEMLPFEDASKKVYAKLFEVSGNAASPIQFQITDSTKHFISGSLYFDARPNFDSILPAIDYLKVDIKKLIESLEWD